MSKITQLGTRPMTARDTSIPDYRDLATRNLDRAVKAEAEAAALVHERDDWRSRCIAAEARTAPDGLASALALASRERQTRADRDATIAAMEEAAKGSPARIAALVAELYAAKVARDALATEHAGCGDLAGHLAVTEARRCEAMAHAETATRLRGLALIERDEARGEAVLCAGERDSANERCAVLTRDLDSERLVRKAEHREQRGETYVETVERAAELRGAFWMKEAAVKALGGVPRATVVGLSPPLVIAAIRSPDYVAPAEPCGVATYEREPEDGG